MTGNRPDRAGHRQDELELRAKQRELFRERLQRGDYDGLYERSLRSIMEKGAAVHGIGEELGAVRYALARLVNEEEDPNRLAAGVARLATATVQLLRVVRPTIDQADDAIIESINQVLIRLERDARRARAEGRPTPRIAPQEKSYLQRRTP